MFVRATLFFVFGVILSSLFIWSIMQGVMIHLSHPDNVILSQKDAAAFSYYFVGWISGIGALALYWQAKKLFHLAEISK